MILSPEHTAEKIVHDIFLSGQQWGEHDWELAKQIIATAIRHACNEAEQQAIDRCREIISRAIISENTDGEGMRRLLLAAFDPRWDKVASIIKDPTP